MTFVYFVLRNVCMLNVIIFPINTFEQQIKNLFFYNFDKKKSKRNPKLIYILNQTCEALVQIIHYLIKTYMSHLLNVGFIKVWIFVTNIWRKKIINVYTLGIQRKDPPSGHYIFQRKSYMTSIDPPFLKRSHLQGS